MKPKISSEEISWLLIPERIPATEVAKKLRLPQRGNVLTEIDLELTPYIVPILELIGDTRVKWLFGLGPTQSAKSVVLQVAVADMIDQDPGPALYLLPDEVSGRKHIQEKITRVIEETPALFEHTTGKVRDMSKRGIELDHMTIQLGWSNSLATISSFPQKRVFLDELRLMKLEVGKESNAVQLAEDRLTTYLHMGIGQGLGVSTPSVKGDLLYNQLDVPGTTVWVWQVPCPECGQFQRLTFKHIKFDKKAEKARCHCEYCNGVFDDFDNKTDWNGKGMYVRKIQNESGDWVDTKVINGIPEYPFKITERMVFWWDSLVSPFRPFHRIWRKFTEVKDKLHDYKNFVQCWLAEFWIDDVSKTTAEGLRSRRSPNYVCGEVPPGVKVITAGIDTQDDGFYVAVHGWGSHKYAPLIDKFFIPCHMETAGIKDIITVWKRDIFDRIFIDEQDEKWKIALCAIDTGGHRTKAVYEAAVNFPRMIMVKGRNNQDISIKFNKELSLYLVRTCEYLDETEEHSTSSQFLLPKDISTDYLRQFCNMRKVREKNKKTGEQKVIWVKTGQSDYRMASVHAYICLDIDTDRGRYRNEIDKDNFIYQVYRKVIKNKINRVDGDPRYVTAREQQDDFIHAGKEW